MTAATAPTPAARPALDGWLEACLFAIALSVLNVSYAVGHQIGAHPVAFIAYAMPIAALTLLMITGPGPDWRAIMLHPLSFAIGGGIIAMETAYYLLLEHVSPTDGSLLVRLNVPVGILLGLLLMGRRPSFLSLAGALVVTGGIALCAAGIPEARLPMGLTLGALCAFIMTARVFATEAHPWNRDARTVREKMRITGLVLLVSSLLGVVALATAMVLVAHGHMRGPAWLPRPEHFLHYETYLLGLFMGGVVLTAIQYLAFSTVVKIKSESFLATTALIPPVTLAFQIAAAWLGLIPPMPVDWRTLPAMAVVMAGVLLVVWGVHRRSTAHAVTATLPTAMLPAGVATGVPAATLPAPHGRAWAAIAAATLLGLPYGTIYAFSVLLQPLEALLAVPRAELTFVFGLSAIGFTVGMNIAPLLFGRLPAAAIIAVATAVNVAGIALSAAATGTLELAIGYGALFGISSGMAFTAYQQGVNLVVKRHLGLVNGYIVSLFPAGAMIGAPLLDWGIANWGVRAALAGLAAVFAITGVLAIVLFLAGGVRVSEPPRPAGRPSPSAAAASGIAARGRRVVFWKIFAVFFVAAAAGLMVLSQAAGIVAAYGGAGALAVAATTGITGAIAAARLTGGWLVDRFAVPHVMAFAQALALAGAVVLTAWPGPWVAVITLGLVGIGYGIISGSTAAAIGLYWERRDFGKMASRLYIAWCIAAVTLPVLAARLFDLTGGYRTAVVLAGIGNLAGVLVALTLPRRSPASLQHAPQAASG